MGSNGYLILLSSKVCLTTHPPFPCSLKVYCEPISIRNNEQPSLVQGLSSLYWFVGLLMLLVCLFSLKTKQWIGNLKMNGSVGSVAFSADGSRMFTGGGISSSLLLEELVTRIGFVSLLSYFMAKTSIHFWPIASRINQNCKLS